MNAQLEQLYDALARARAEIAKVIIGQDAAVLHSLIVLLSGQHALVEGVPGIAKTLLVRTLAKVFASPFSRIQFTPDLLPADITGTNIFNLQKNEFVLAPGPVFTVFLLADEINRAPAKTQSALLQAMQERTVSIDRETYRLSPDFTVFATQNPFEFEGTYALPEAQKDRFMLRIGMTWPEREDELLLAGRILGSAAPEIVLEREVNAVLPLDEFSGLRKSLESVVFQPELLQYLVDLVRRSRHHESILLGAGPRATQAIALASRAHALCEGRDFVTPDDIRAMSQPVLEHRLILRPEAEVEGVTAAEAIQDMLKETPVPR
jgi:MoxR-like ATPase